MQYSENAEQLKKMDALGNARQKIV